MNQNRWTCLTTVVLTTAIGSVASVHASTLPFSAPRSGANYIPVSPQSLPTITPLVVTELETDAIIPTQFTPVPLVSKLPIVKVIANQSKPSARSKRDPLSKLRTQPAIAKLPSVNPIFHPNIRVTDPAFSIANPTNSRVAIVSPVFPLPLPISITPKTQTFITPVTAIAAVGLKVDRVWLNSLPQSAPIIRDLKDYRTKGLIQGQDLPMFEAGVPTFGINDQTTQIVVTAIAQVGDTIVAPEPSIAIPVEQKQPPTTPSKFPTSVPLTVKIGQPITTPVLDQIVATQSGQASWYGSEAGSQTASGERYNPSGLTAAHRTLPFGTKVRITSLKTGKTVIVRINDRGPSSRRRIIDVSAAAAEVIGIKNDGIGQVRVDVLGQDG
ncbi:MAG: septal ring lytic transglycosylase RlpA family protein [Chamaesiphon sp.]|nr:septal ring lytic transglycosylase RlpA family protein [Chamaesiphon sp.]